MHDVLAKLVVAAGDPHLRAGEAIAAVVLRLGAGGDVGERGAGLRLGQAHRAEEAAFEHRLQVQALLLVGAVRREQVGDAAREQGVAGGGDVGGQNIASQTQRDDEGQLHAAVGLVGEQRGEAGLGVGIERLASLPG